MKLAPGFQADVVALNRLPTVSPPVNVGRGVALKAGVVSGSAKWMNPSGHPDPDLVIRRWSNVRPQLDSETMISVGEATFST
ncbi:hypothetical protein ASF05_07120 [Aeromicrobium sp. Leaf245]|nr:hypothetical protein ASF05_07120 [Aeromicrobium sp. Leaf245]